MDRVEYEIVRCELGFLEAVYTINGRQMMAAVHWDGAEDIDKALRRTAVGVAQHMRRPPPPTKEMMERLIGTRGSVDVPIGTPPNTDL